MKLHARLFAVVICCLAAASAPAQDRPAHDGKTAVFGTLHAHSILSGDVDDDEGFTPREAFAYARAHGLDFLGISDHRQEKVGRFHLQASAYEDSLYEVAMALNALHAGEFVAIPGIEWGISSRGNHINVFGAPTLPPDLEDDLDYVGLYDWIAENALFAQGNHPYAWRRKGDGSGQAGNYGRDLFEDDDAFVAKADGSLSLMSIICTVQGGHMRGHFSHADSNTHREMSSKALRVYQDHLNMGFHLSPAGNQDTHGRNPGTVTATRTGIWVDEFTLDGITDAVQAHRIFATEDDELAVAMQVEYGGRTYWMGETVELSAAEQDVTVIVQVAQAEGVDNDSPDEGPYVATLFSDSDGIGGGRVAEWETYDIPAANNRLEVEVPVVAGEYFYFEVRETGGSDNLVGEGDDELMADGSEGSDGFRDDPNDSAWTSPIWMTLASASGPYIWSINSGLYHDPDCWAVKRIGQANRREGEAPAGKTKHDCHP